MTVTLPESEPMTGELATYTVAPVTCERERTATEAILNLASDRIKVIEGKFAPAKAAAHAAHKTVCALENEAKAPYVAIKDGAGRELTTFIRIERARIAEEERKAREEKEREAARQREIEAENMKAAKEAEASGDAETALEFVQEAAVAAMQATAAETAPIAVEPVAKGDAVVRTIWKAEVSDIKALCRAVADGTVPSSYVEANISALNAAARAGRAEARIPGVRVFEDIKVGAKARR